MQLKKAFVGTRQQFEPTFHTIADEVYCVILWWFMIFLNFFSKMFFSRWISPISFFSYVSSRKSRERVGKQAWRCGFVEWGKAARSVVLFTDDAIVCSACPAVFCHERTYTWSSSSAAATFPKHVFSDKRGGKSGTYWLILPFMLESDPMTYSILSFDPFRQIT